ncbi:MAG: hypothetical protein RIQ99_163, partial [Pseudomonadota bacterium]
MRLKLPLLRLFCVFMPVSLVLPAPMALAAPQPAIAAVPAPKDRGPWLYRG